MALIEIKNVKKHYTSGDDVVEALRGVDITIEAGEFITIMGQSGSGKSTLLSVLGGMNHPTSGEVEMAGVKLYQLPGEKLADFRAQNLGFVFQSFHLIPYLTAIENVMLPLAIVKMSTSSQKERCPPGPGTGRPGRQAGPSAQPALRRRTGAGRHCPGHRQQPAHPAGRRTDRQPGFKDQRRGHGALPGTERSRPDRRHGHPQSGERELCRPDDPPEGRNCCRPAENCAITET